MGGMVMQANRIRLQMPVSGPWIILNGLLLSTVEPNPPKVMEFIKSKGSRFEVNNGMLDVEILFTTEDVIREIPEFYAFKGELARSHPILFLKYKLAMVFEKIDYVADKILRTAAETVEFFMHLKQLAAKKISAAYNYCAEKLNNFYAALSSMIRQTVDAVLNAIQQTVDFVSRKVRQAINAVTSAVQRVVDGVTYGVQKTVDGVLTGVDQVVGFVFNAAMYVVQATTGMKAMITNTDVSVSKPIARPAVNKVANPSPDAGVAPWIFGAAKPFIPGFFAHNAAANCPSANKAAPKAPAALLKYRN